MGFCGVCASGDLHRYLFPSSKSTPRMGPDGQCSSPKTGKELSLAEDMAGTSSGTFFLVTSPVSLWGKGRGWQEVRGRAGSVASAQRKHLPCLPPASFLLPVCAISIKDVNNHFPRT